MVSKPLFINKDTTLILKGIAILLMIWLHLFNRTEYLSLCSHLVTIDGTPLAQIIQNACNPVGLFCFLSGYGIYFSYSKKNLGLQSGFIDGIKRVVKLYISLWIIFLIFIPVCSFISPEIYPGEATIILTNIMAYTNTWNHTVWFVLPFALVMLTYSLWFKLLESRTGTIVFAISSFALYYIVAIIYGHYWSNLQEFRPLLVCCRYIELLTPFAFGAIIQKFSNVEIRINQKILEIGALILSAALFIFSCFKGIPFYPVYCAIFMIALANIKYCNVLSKNLSIFGKYSMIIWLTHTYYFEVLLKNQIYLLKYPVLVFMSATIISLIVAILLDKIILPIVLKNK